MSYLADQEISFNEKKIFYRLFTLQKSFATNTCNKIKQNVLIFKNLFSYKAFQGYVLEM